MAAISEPVVSIAASSVMVLTISPGAGPAVVIASADPPGAQALPLGGAFLDAAPD